ncbi:MAG: hypothetical protein WBG58_09285 [Ignavibacteriaceae bacterium]
MKSSCAILLILISFSCAEKGNEPLTFSVMGDVPRSEVEDSIIQQQIHDHNDSSNSEFMIHVGDIKDGLSPCEENVYKKVKGYLKKIKVPTFIVPGDNEWNDCENPETAWGNWVKYFLGFEENWSSFVDVERQNIREENFAFNYKGVLIIGLNLVGGLVHDSLEWKSRHLQNADWVETQFNKSKDDVRAAVIFAQANLDEKHISFTERFQEYCCEFKKPVIFIHGDGHTWLYDNPWLEPNLIRIQVDNGGIAPPLKVTVELNPDSIISFNRNLQL